MHKVRWLKESTLREFSSLYILRSPPLVPLTLHSLDPKTIRTNSKSTFAKQMERRVRMW